MSREKKRSIWIDALRGFTIILVLLGHNNPPFMRYIYGFHMPLFFMLSGDLFKDSPKVWLHIVHIFKRYVLTYFGLCLINLAIYLVQAMIVMKTTHIDLSIIPDSIIGMLLVDGSRMHGCYTLWFLPVLALSLIMFVLITAVKSVPFRVCAVGVLSTIGFILGYKGIDLPFRINVALVGLLFVAVGFWIRHTDVIHEVRDKLSSPVQIIVLVSCAMAGYFAINYNIPDSRVDMSSAHYGNVMLFITGAFMWTLVLMLLFSIVVHKYGTKSFKFLATLGKHTMFIMAFDESSNLTGGMLIDYYKITHTWYGDFVFRCIVLFGYFLIYFSIKWIVTHLLEFVGKVQ